jgi:hypothetical protein
MTNGDRIRAMSDEELAEILEDFRVDGARPCGDIETGTGKCRPVPHGTYNGEG